MSKTRQSIVNDLSRAMKEKNIMEVGTLRMLKAALERLSKEKGTEPTEEEVLKTIKQETKKRKESIEAFQKAGRHDLADKENQELNIISKYLPPELSDEELAVLVEEVIKENNFSSADFGQAMKAVMVKVGGQADGSRISALVKQKLS